MPSKQVPPVPSHIQKFIESHPEFYIHMEKILNRIQLYHSYNEEPNEYGLTYGTKTSDYSYSRDTGFHITEGNPTSLKTDKKISNEQFHLHTHINFRQEVNDPDPASKLTHYFSGNDFFKYIGTDTPSCILFNKPIAKKTQFFLKCLTPKKQDADHMNKMWEYRSAFDQIDQIIDTQNKWQEKVGQITSAQDFDNLITEDLKKPKTKSPETIAQLQQYFQKLDQLEQQLGIETVLFTQKQNPKPIREEPLISIYAFAPKKQIALTLPSNQWELERKASSWKPVCQLTIGFSDRSSLAKIRSIQQENREEYEIPFIVHNVLKWKVDRSCASLISASSNSPIDLTYENYDRYIPLNRLAYCIEQPSSGKTRDRSIPQKCYSILHMPKHFPRFRWDDLKTMQLYV